MQPEHITRNVTSPVRMKFSVWVRKCMKTLILLIWSKCFVRADKAIKEKIFPVIVKKFSSRHKQDILIHNSTGTRTDSKMLGFSLWGSCLTGKINMQGLLWVAHHFLVQLCEYFIGVSPELSLRHNGLLNADRLFCYTENGLWPHVVAFDTVNLVGTAHSSVNKISASELIDCNH